MTCSLNTAGNNTTSTRNFTYYSSCNHEQIAIWTYTVITEVQRFDLKHCDSIYDLIWKFCDSIWIVRSRQIVYLLTDSKRIRWLCSSYVCNAALHCTDSLWLKSFSVIWRQWTSAYNISESTLWWDIVHITVPCKIWFDLSLQKIWGLRKNGDLRFD